MTPSDFSLHVARVLNVYKEPYLTGFNVSINADDKPVEFDAAVWANLLNNIVEAITNNMDQAPERAVSMLGCMLEPATVTVTSSFTRILDRLNDAGLLVQLCKYGWRNQDVLYALATHFGSCQLHLEDKNSVEQNINALIGRHFAFGKDITLWNNDVLVAMFGTQWAVLYGMGKHSPEATFERVFIERPSFFWMQSEHVTSPELSLDSSG